MALEKPDPLPIDEELRGALSREIAYEDNLYFMRSLMGAGIKTSQDAMDFLGDMSATSKAMAAANIQKIEELKRTEAMSDAERQSRIDAATAAANQRADQLGKEVATAIAMDPTKAAGAIQAAGLEQSRIIEGARTTAETNVNFLEAALEGQRVEELLTREDAEMQRKQARTKGKFDFVRDLLQGAGQVVAATRPRTREAQLETEVLKGKKKGEKFASKLKAHEAKSKGGMTDKQSTRYVERSKSLAEKKATAEASGTAAGKELDLLQRAKQAEKAARWASYNPFSPGAQPPQPLAKWEAPKLTKYGAFPKFKA